MLAEVGCVFVRQWIPDCHEATSAECERTLLPSRPALAVAIASYT
jgi:hypothetical protein